MRTVTTSSGHRLPLLLLLLAVAALVLPPADAAPHPGPPPASCSSGAPARAGTARYVPPVRHVFVVNIENKGYDETWGPDSAAPYLARTCAARAC